MVTDGPRCDHAPFSELCEVVERGLKLLTDGSIRTRVIDQPCEGTANRHRDLFAGGRCRLSSPGQHACHSMRCSKKLGDQWHGFGEPGLDLGAGRCCLTPGMLGFHHSIVAPGAAQVTSQRVVYKPVRLGFLASTC